MGGTHDHSQVPKDFGKAFAIGTALNLAYVVVQVLSGIFAHSLALLADAGHNLGDVLGLLLAWGRLSSRRHGQLHTMRMGYAGLRFSLRSRTPHFF